MMLLENKFNIGQTVYLKTDVEQYDRIVTGLSVRPNTIMYVLSYSNEESYHYDFEITEEKNVLKTTTN